MPAPLGEVEWCETVHFPACMPNNQSEIVFGWVDINAFFFAQEMEDVLAEGDIRQGMGVACFALKHWDAAVSAPASTDQVAIGMDSFSLKKVDATLRFMLKARCHTCAPVHSNLISGHTRTCPP